MDREQHLQRLAADASTYRAATAALEQARDALVRRALDAMADGIGQADILRATEHVWTREHLRKLAREDDRRGSAPIRSTAEHTEETS